MKNRTKRRWLRATTRRELARRVDALQQQVVGLTVANTAIGERLVERVVTGNGKTLHAMLNESMQSVDVVLTDHTQKCCDGGKRTLTLRFSRTMLHAWTLFQHGQALDVKLQPADEKKE